jgi:hypothetical protein
MNVSKNLVLVVALAAVALVALGTSVYDLDPKATYMPRLAVNEGTLYTVNTTTLAATAVTATASELNILDGCTATYAELNILDGVTATAAELNILDGATLDYTELNALDGINTSTVTAAKLNILAGITATAAEVNQLDDAIVRPADLSAIYGLTVTTSTLNNAVKGASSGYQIVAGTTSVTGTGTVASGLTTVTSCLAGLGQAPDVAGECVATSATGASVSISCFRPVDTTDCTAVNTTSSRTIWYMIYGQ